MDDQTKDQAAAPADEAQPERYSTGIKPLDTVAHKVDAGVRRISKEVHEGMAGDPSDDRERHSLGIEKLDNAVHKIDNGVRAISQGLHKAIKR